MEKFRINKDNSVDVVIDISENLIVTISPELFEEVSYQLSSRPISEEQFARQRAERQAAAIDEELNKQAQIDREVKEDLQFEEHKDKAYQEWINESDDEDYDNAKQDGLIK